MACCTPAPQRPPLCPVPSTCPQVETVGKGTECGVLLEGFSDIQPGDVLQCITTELRATAQVQAGPEKEWHL